MADRARRAAPPVHRGRRLAPLQIWGMGIASQDLTGDGYPEVFLTSQGDNKLQTLDRPDPDRRTTTSPCQRGVTAHAAVHRRRRAPVDRLARRVRRRQQRRLVDLFVTKGNVEAQADYAMRDPSNLLLGQADGTFVEGARATRASSASSAVAALRSST